MASPNNHNYHDIKIAYDVKTKRGKQRKIKTFTNPYDANRFWKLKDKQGMNPKIQNSKEKKNEEVSSPMDGNKKQSARRRRKRY